MPPEMKRSEFNEHNNKAGLQASCFQYQKQINEAFTKCSERAENIINALEGKDFPSKDESVQETGQPKQDGKETLQRLLEDWFDVGINDTERITEIKKEYKNIKEECDKKEKTRIGIQCGDCPENTLGQAYQGTGPILLCKLALERDRRSTNIRDVDLGGTLMHEMSHVISNTNDTGYGVTTCKNLRAKAAIQNAESYMFGALAATLGDDTGPGGEGGKVPDSSGGKNPDSSGRKDPDSTGGKVLDSPRGKVPDFMGGKMPDSLGGKSSPHNTSKPNLPLTPNPTGIIGDGTSSSSSAKFYPPKTSSSSGNACFPTTVSSSGGFSSGQAPSASRHFSQVASHPEAYSLPKVPHSKGSPAPSNGDLPAVI